MAESGGRTCARVRRGAWASRREDRGAVARRYVCARVRARFAHEVAHTGTTCAAMRARTSSRIGIRIGSTNGRKLVTAGLSDLPAVRAPPSAREPLSSHFDPLRSPSIALSCRPSRRRRRALSSRSLPLSLSVYLPLRLSRQLANLPTRVPLFGNY